MIRKFLNWLFGKKQETNKYAPLPTLNDIPASHVAVSVETPNEDHDWHTYLADAKQPEVEVGTLEAPVAETKSTESVEQVKTETTKSLEEPKAIHNKPKRKYHKKKHKH